MSTALRTYYRGHTLSTLRDEAAGQSRVYHFDHQGTTQCLTDTAGAVTDRFASDAWGVQVKRTGATSNPHWYVGENQYYGLGTARRYVRLRHMSAAGGCWISVDPQQFAESKYHYVGNRPSLSIDPSGLVQVIPVRKAEWIVGNDPKQCGQFLGFWRLERRKRGCAGWLIQKMTFWEIVHECNGQLARNLQDQSFWEGWRVPANQLIDAGRAPGASNDMFAKSPEPDRYSRRVNWLGTVKFFCDTTINRFKGLHHGESPSAWPPGQNVSALCSRAGIRPCKADKPVWWDLASDEGEGLAHHDAYSSWSCCGCETQFSQTTLLPSEGPTPTGPLF